MSVYSFDNAYYLYEDISHVLKRISDLYDFKETEEPNFLSSKRFLADGIHWASEEGQNAFNKLIPEIKSIHKDMYHLIECVAKDKNGKNFDVRTLEAKYEYLPLMRDFNNKIKHANKRNIDVTYIAILDGQSQQVEILVYDKDNQKTLLYSNFIILFFKILEDYEIITVRRN